MANKGANLAVWNRRSSLAVVFLRVVIGWHFLYEGVSKMLMEKWTCAGYLESSRWLLSDFFHWIAQNPSVLRAVDLLNIWGLSFIGLGLILGFLTRLSSVAGIFLLALYYVANPPFVANDFGFALEGSYLIVNKNMVEMVALAVVAMFPSGQSFGFDRALLSLWRRLKPTAEGAEGAGEPLGRREALKSLATVPVLGAFAYAALHKERNADGTTGATIRVSESSLKDLKGELPKGKIGEKEISRIILGGNLIGGWAHARDLLYVDSLFKAYNQERKVFETLMLAEQAGVNTINITHSQFPLINKYKRLTGSKLQTVCQIHPTKDDIRSHADKTIDCGVDFIQIQGNCCDWRVRDGEIDVLAECIEHIRSQGFPAGLGAHSIQALMACEKAGIDPDFYMKTLHHDNYWSAHPKENRLPFSVDGKRSNDHNQFHDNMFCLFPEETIAFMKRKEIPWMAFKVLAGGAIHPRSAFKYAFENGADFVCVGMFDFQVVDDVNIGIDTLAGLKGRERPWYA